ncbi:MAG: DUF167 domain-containing protein [Candidatus Thorarchaeota archaeon]
MKYHLELHETMDKQAVIRVIVRPGSKSRQLIDEVEDDHISMNLRSPAREGKANAELVKRFAKALGISSSAIRIQRGHRSREKAVVIDGLDKADVLQRLRAML